MRSITGWQKAMGKTTPESRSPEILSARERESYESVKESPRSPRSPLSVSSASEKVCTSFLALLTSAGGFTNHVTQKICSKL